MLQKIAKLANIDGSEAMNKTDLIDALAKYEANQDSNGVRFAELVKQL